MDRLVRRTRRPWFALPMTVALLMLACLTPVAAVGAWVFLVDPEMAADLIARDPLSVAAVVARALGRAIVALLAYL